ncbi:uncharacterized protein AB675_2511 [Cyphellophora attinorum]|uniref:ChrR-like cupin domain-containing protein n=1 Tax=Cyphellophora attinorum TaxID=1664694 RepID=A0A0N1HGL0_9EURO|nr:uncharacterized protein AB675_2511 [Phialophora attinorum]KPI44824.1 hypothetical protein AB675_2511 [Phialophora attinorum]
MPPSSPVPLTVIDTNTTPWQPFPVPYLNVNLDHNPLHQDEGSGMTILKLQYKRGFTNPWHSHYCGHGFYVLDGILDTHAGQYGPGSWVWFPEGGTMYHGATREKDVTVLFITNKKFSIHFVGDGSDPCALQMRDEDLRNIVPQPSQ